MALFDVWKKGFEAWEQGASKALEAWLKNPAVLEQSGAMLSAFMRMKKASDDAMSLWWSTLGLPTKRDQERTLHELHRLQSKILDLEEQLAEAKRERKP